MSDKIERCAKCGKEPACSDTHYAGEFLYWCDCEQSRAIDEYHWNDRQRLIRAEARIKVLEEALRFYANQNNYSIRKGSYPTEFDCTADADTYCGVKKIDGIDRHVVLHGKIAINALRGEL